MTDTLHIRCSMLPGWVDCARRATAKQYSRMVEGHGFTLRKLLSPVAASIGTAVHTAVAKVLEAKRDGLTPDIESAIEAGRAEFKEDIRGGCILDATTPNTQDAYTQIERLTKAFLPLVADIEPVLIEEQFKANLDPGWMLTGKIDLYTAAFALDDLKTGALPRPYIQQAGGYVLLCESHGKRIKTVGTTFVQRVRTNEPQPAPVSHVFPLESARNSAWAAIQEIMPDVGKFATTGDLWLIRANPMSMMCTEKYCPAWGTDFCTVHLQGK